MAVKNVTVKENTVWKKLRRGFKVNRRWELTRSELKVNKTWSDVKVGMGSYTYDAQRVWEDIKADRERRKSKSAQSYLVEDV